MACLLENLGRLFGLTLLFFSPNHEVAHDLKVTRAGRSQERNAVSIDCGLREAPAILRSLVPAGVKNVGIYILATSEEVVIDNIHLKQGEDS